MYQRLTQLRSNVITNGSYCLETVVYLRPPIITNHHNGPTHNTLQLSHCGCSGYHYGCTMVLGYESSTLVVLLTVIRHQSTLLKPPNDISGDFTP